MDKLPHEIICDIFLTACQLKLHNEREVMRLRACRLPVPSSISNFAPLDISHVCRSWRRIALSYGDIWSYMCITFTRVWLPHFLPIVKEGFDTWLRRTRRSPLNITFMCCVRYSDAQDLVEHMLMALVDQQHR